MQSVEDGHQDPAHNDLILGIRCFGVSRNKSRYEIGDFRSIDTSGKPQEMARCQEKGL